MELLKDMPDQQEIAAPDAATSAFRPVRAYATLALLLALYTLSFLDRTILSLLITPLKQELHLDDFEVSLLAGMAFSLFYAAMGLPIAYLADRHSRRTLISVGVCLWSLMTALGGLAGNYAMLFITRMGVGLGEAALGPAAYSLIADIFPRKKIGRAMAIYTIGAPLGMGMALVLGGEVVRFVNRVGTVAVPMLGMLSSWRLVLVTVGLPGILCGLAMLLVREPPRISPKGSKSGPAEPAFTFIWARIGIFMPIFTGLSLMAGITYGIALWAPTLYLRKFGIPAADAATPIGLAIGIGGVLGMLAGGTVADRLFARGISNAYVRVLAMSVAGALPFFVIMPLMPTAESATLCLFLASFCQCCQAGLPAASIQLITPNHLRARVTALYILMTSIIGLGVGPTAMGAASRYIFGEAHIGSAIALVAAIELPVAVLLIASTLDRYRRAVEALAPDSPVHSKPAQ